jgi:hypothetical protein
MMLMSTPRARVRVIFGLAIAAAMAWEIDALFLPATTIRAAGVETYEIKEFSAGVPVGQTFRARTDGLNTAVVTFSADRPCSLTVRYRLMGWAPAKVDHWASVIEGTETIRLTSGTNRQPFRFKAIVDSNRQVYQFQVQQLEVHGLAADAGAAPSVGLMASRDNALDEGNLILGTAQLIDRDLLFAASGADSRFDDFRMRINPQLPRNLRLPAVQWILGLTLVALYDWALAIFAYHVLIGATDPAARP